MLQRFSVDGSVAFRRRANSIPIKITPECYKVHRNYYFVWTDNLYTLYFSNQNVIYLDP